MFILRNAKNKGAEAGKPMPGDIIISGDKRKSYVVGDDHSHHRTDAAEHQKALEIFESEKIMLPGRKEREQDIIQQELAKLYSGR